jgi:hypothetical protein
VEAVAEPLILPSAVLVTITEPMAAVAALAPGQILQAVMQVQIVAEAVEAEHTITPTTTAATADQVLLLSSIIQLTQQKKHRKAH